MTTDVAPSVDPTYRHVDKVAVPVAAPGPLKWYDIREPSRSISEDVRAEAHEKVASLVSPSDLGFVLLHLCGDDFYFLLVSRWRNENELWETVLAKSGDAPFELVEPGATHATFCVWELAVVNAERLAWIDFLRTARSAADLAAYQSARFSGAV
jgi:hypothetical protein